MYDDLLFLSLPSPHPFPSPPPSSPPLLTPITAHPPLQLVQNCADHYLTSEHKSIRMEAVRTCASLLVPNLLPPTIFTTPFAQFSAASAQLVGEVVGKLLTVGITDQGRRKEPGPSLLLSILSFFSYHMFLSCSFCSVFLSLVLLHSFPSFSSLSADEEIRECVFMALDERFDAHLAQAENLSTLFVAMHDGVGINCHCRPFMYVTVNFNL